MLQPNQSGKKRHFAEVIQRAGINLDIPWNVEYDKPMCYGLYKEVLRYTDPSSLSFETFFCLQADSEVRK